MMGGMIAMRTQQASTLHAKELMTPIKPDPKFVLHWMLACCG